MSLHRLQIADERNRTVPAGRSAGNVFEHVGLRSYRVGAWGPISDPAEVDAGEIFRDALRFRDGIGARRGLHNFGPEDIKCVAAGENMPTKVRFARPFSE